jgi:hypothetical protein
MTALEALKLAQKTGFDQHLQSVVVAGDDPEYAYRFACDVPGAEFDALEEVILRSTDLRTVYDFAVLKAHQGGDITLLQDRVLAGGDGGLMILFAADVAGADTLRFEAALRQLPNPKFLLLFEAEMREKGID